MYNMSTNSYTWDMDADADMDTAADTDTDTDRDPDAETDADTNTDMNKDMDTGNAHHRRWRDIVLPMKRYYVSFRSYWINEAIFLSRQQI
jgi:hypothetical protein